MMEMLETAHIIKSATPRSLILMDEIGRGTSADEGYALAWAVCQHLNENLACRTLFATHYSQLADLVRSYAHGQLLKTTAYEDDSGTITFMHSIVSGIASHSYAIAIARYAGIPNEIVSVAQQKLDSLREKFFNKN